MFREHVPTGTVPRTSVNAREVTPKIGLNFEQGSTVNIPECNNQLELSSEYIFAALTWYLLIPV